MSTIALNLDLADAVVLERAVASTLSACNCEDAPCEVDLAERAALAYIQAELVRMLYVRDKARTTRDRLLVGTGRAELRLLKSAPAVPIPLRAR